MVNAGNDRAGSGEIVVSLAAHQSRADGESLIPSIVSRLGTRGRETRPIPGLLRPDLSFFDGCLGSIDNLRRRCYLVDKSELKGLLRIDRLALRNELEGLF